MGKGGTFLSALVVINTFNLHDDSMNWFYHLIDRVTELVPAIKILPASARDGRDEGSIPGLDDPLTKGMAPTRLLAWRSPWTEEPGELQSMGVPRVGHESTHSAEAQSSQMPPQEHTD